eukprot:COSAG01_NODE_8583_length_2729_cov_1.599240_3_plen_199_part_00
MLTVTYCVAVPRGLHPLRPNSLTVGARRTESADCAPRSSRASPLTGFVGASALQFAGRRRESKRGMHRDRELRNERLVRRQLRQVDVLKAIRIGPRAVIALVIVCRFQRSVRSVSGHRRGSMFSVQTAAHCPGGGAVRYRGEGLNPSLTQLAGLQLCPDWRERSAIPSHELRVPVTVSTHRVPHPGEARPLDIKAGIV